MAVDLPPEDVERRAAQRDAQKYMQDAIKERLSTPKALARAVEGSWSGRKDAIQMFGFLGRDADVVSLALDEREAQAVLDHAMKFLPAPVELVMHRLTMKRGDAPMAMRYVIAEGNYLYAEAAIVPVVAKTPARLPASVLDAFGAAGFRSVVPMLDKHAKLGAMRTYADAIAAGREQDKPELFGPSTPPGSTWDGPTERAFAAVAALRRLDAPVDVEAVAAWRDAIDTVMNVPGSLIPIIARGVLTWVLFDTGADRCFDEWLASEVRQADTLYDMAATLLKRGDAARMERLVPLLEQRGAGASRRFCHWPVADWCHARGLVPVPADSFHEIYCLSRDAGIAPPPWWRWQTAWERGIHSDRLRGLL